VYAEGILNNRGTTMTNEELCTLVCSTGGCCNIMSRRGLANLNEKTHDVVEREAYILAEARGFEPGFAEADWKEAEETVYQRIWPFLPVVINHHRRLPRYAVGLTPSIVVSKSMGN
jgi:hypothetical protein